jgi:hypothetical protein
MSWKELAAGLGTQTTVSALRAAKGNVSKTQYKRLIATAVAQLLEEHPDIGPRKARRRARRITGARPSKKMLRTSRMLGLKEGAEGAAGAAVVAGLAKVAGIMGSKLKEKFGDDHEVVRHDDEDGEPEAGSGTEAAAGESTDGRY